MNKINSLQAGRAVAALLVAFYHIHIYILVHDGVAPLGGVFARGFLGVHFFFVLSGFIIFYAHHADIGHPSTVGNYLAKRFNRLYPLYFLISSAALVAYIALPGLGDPTIRSSPIVLSSLLLVPLHAANAGGAVLGVAWTLFHEVLFYAVFATLLFSRLWGTIVLLAWLALCAIPGSLGWLPAPVNYLISPMNLLFGFGWVAFWVMQRDRPFPVTLFAVVGAALLGVTLAVEVSLVTSVYLAGTGVALIILSAASAERGGRLTVSPVLVRLGEASYSIYLTHYLVVSAAGKVIYSVWPTFNGTLAFLTLTLLVIPAGVTCHLLIERPLLRWGRSALAPTGGRLTPPP